MNPNDGRGALATVLAATAIGLVWWLFLVLEPFSLGILRVIPLIWLVLALVGCTSGLRAVSFNNHRGLGVLSILIGLLNIPLAGIFLLGALMGDQALQ